MSFVESLRREINLASRENRSDTPDHILAEYMLACLEAGEKMIKDREIWYGRKTDDAAQGGRYFAWAEYRKEYQPNPRELNAAHKAFLAGWEASKTPTSDKPPTEEGDESARTD